MDIKTAAKLLNTKPLDDTAEERRLARNTRRQARQAIRKVGGTTDNYISYGPAWRASDKRRGSRLNRAIEALQKKLMPEWRRVMPALMRAFGKLQRHDVKPVVF